MVEHVRHIRAVPKNGISPSVKAQSTIMSIFDGMTIYVLDEDGSAELSIKFSGHELSVLVDSEGKIRSSSFI